MVGGGCENVNMGGGACENVNIGGGACENVNLRNCGWSEILHNTPSHTHFRADVSDIRPTWRSLC